MVFCFIGKALVVTYCSMARLKSGEYEVEGVVLESLPNMTYRVQVTDGPEQMIGKQILTTVSGQMKMFKIKVMPGDGVKVLMTQYDSTKGRITFRSKEVKQAPVAAPQLEVEAEPIIGEALPPESAQAEPKA